MKMKITNYTLEEGDEWKDFPINIEIHSLRFEDGREFDIINGNRKNTESSLIDTSSKEVKK